MLQGESITYGKCHCQTFWQLLAVVQWIAQEFKDAANAELDEHIATCPDCQRWINDPPVAKERGK